MWRILRLCWVTMLVLWLGWCLIDVCSHIIMRIIRKTITCSHFIFPLFCRVGILRMMWWLVVVSLSWRRFAKECVNAVVYFSDLFKKWSSLVAPVRSVYVIVLKSTWRWDIAAGRQSIRDGDEKIDCQRYRFWKMTKRFNLTGLWAISLTCD